MSRVNKFGCILSVLLATSTVRAQTEAGLESRIRWSFSGAINVTKLDVELRLVLSAGDIVADRVSSSLFDHPSADQDGLYSARLGDHFSTTADGSYDLYLRVWRGGNRSAWSGPVSISWSTSPPATPENPIVEERGSILLTWDPPTTNEDGSELVDLAGYNLYHVVNTSDLSDSDCKVTAAVTTDVGITTQHKLASLPPGRHWFWVTAYDETGNESLCSNPAFTVVE